MRIAASDRTDTVVDIRPSDATDESDVKAAQQVRVDYTNGTLRITGPKSRTFDFSRNRRSVDVADRSAQRVPGVRSSAGR